MILEKEMSNIPEDLLSLCVSYFGNDNWFYIKHPKLNYESPIRLLQQDVNLVREVLKKDMLDRIFDIRWIL